MAIDTIHIRPDRETDSLPGALDVSELTAGRVTEVAAEADVYLERRGGRTYLVPAN
jgi:hypothetical protein